MREGRLRAISPPSSRRMATVVERGSLPGPGAPLAGRLLEVGSESPGCWMLMKSVRASGVSTMPVTSQRPGPTIMRLNSLWLSGVMALPLRAHGGPSPPAPDLPAS